MKLSIVILAAGKGTRMHSNYPKVLHKIAGKSMVQHVIDNAQALDPAQITVVVGHGAEYVQSELKHNTQLSFALQEPQQGTGHAVQQAESYLVGDTAEDMTLVLYGDVPLVQTNTLRNLLQAAQQEVAVLTEFLEQAAGYGRIVRDENNQVLRIVEHKDANAEELEINEVNTGILCAPTIKLKDWLSRIDNHNAQQEYYLTDIIALAVKDQVAVHAAHPSFSWETLGVNSRIQQAQLERLWQQQLATNLLEQGVTLADPARIDIRGSLSCGRDVFIDVGCIFEGDVVLGDGVSIGPNCVIKNSTLGTNTNIEAFSHIEHTQSEENVSIGPYARLRIGTHLAAASRVGNFVELKNTSLGSQSKANHLSYLGDAQIGQQVNIGAGTITCNYDGINKFKTIIEDNAFIGSDTQLIAPVTIKKGATIGAGTSLRKEAPADKLTITISEQKTLDHWQRPKHKTI